MASLIRVTGKAAKPVSLIYLHRDETSDAILHHLIKVEEGAELTVLENGPAAARFNKCMEVDVADGGGVPPCPRAGPRPRAPRGDPYVRPPGRGGRSSSPSP